MTCSILLAGAADARDATKAVAGRPVVQPAPNYDGYVPPPNGTSYLRRKKMMMQRTPALGDCDIVPDFTGKSFATYGYGTGGAATGDVWTFDHGGPDPLEGWKVFDLTTDLFTAFRVVDQTIWKDNGDDGNVPAIQQKASLWLGFHKGEADTACYAAGMGYGNGWGQRVQSPWFDPGQPDSITVLFKYWIDTEGPSDYVNVVLDDGNSTTVLATLSGQHGSPMLPEIFQMNQVYVEPPYRVAFEFYSDEAGSDEDGGYDTRGAFCVDHVVIAGSYELANGLVDPFGFEDGMEGWEAMPIPFAGKTVHTDDITDFVTVPEGCTLEGKGLVFHNENEMHPAGQAERVVSPAIPLPDDEDPLNLFADYEVYGDMPDADQVYWTWKVSYYPYTCPYSGVVMWSEPEGSPYLFNHPSPECVQMRTFFNDTTLVGGASAGKILVPAGADSVRFMLEVYNLNPNGEAGNWSPLFDNISIGLSDGSYTHIPSPTFQNLWSGFGTGTEGDTILVAPGKFKGKNNKNIYFDGVDRVILSEGGSANTVIDLENGVERAVTFNDGESPNSIFQGFTVIHGAPAIQGACVLVGPKPSSPTIRDIVLKETSINSGGDGVIHVGDGNPFFECVEASDDTSDADIVVVKGGQPSFKDLKLINNHANGAAFRVESDMVAIKDVTIKDNNALCGLYASGIIDLDNAEITGNQGVGMHFAEGSESTIDNANSSGNMEEGIIVENNSSIFSGCVVNQNQGGGIALIFQPQARSSSGAQKVSADTGQPLFRDTQIQGNFTSNADGGGIRIDCSTAPLTPYQPRWENCVVAGNASAFSGGGISVCGDATFADINPIFVNSTVAANSAVGLGGGIYVAVTTSGTGTGFVDFVQSILNGNCTTTGGADAYSTSPNSVSFDCSLLNEGHIEGTGDLIVSTSESSWSPWFCEIPTCDFTGTIQGNFNLAVGSEADGTNNQCGADMGAGAPGSCEFPNAADETPTEMSLLQNVPNPFNPATTISFSVRETSHVTLRVYDVSGRLVRTLVDDNRSPGRMYNMIWDGRDLNGAQVASGVYFYRLVAGDFVETHKMVLLK